MVLSAVLCAVNCKARFTADSVPVDGKVVVEVCFR